MRGSLVALRRRLAALTVALAIAVPGVVANELAPTGHVVPIGGALRNDNDAVWKRLIALAGGAGARFVILPTASGNPDGVAERAAATLQRYGAKAIVLPIGPWWPGSDEAAAREAAALAAHEELIRSANAVFITGGAQGRLIDTLAAGGVESPVLRALRDLQARGGLIAGTSAGAAVMSRMMFREGPKSLAALKGKLRLGKEVDRGFGLVGPHLLVDQHALKRGRFGRMLALMLDQGYPLGLGIDEDTAAVINGQRLEIIGSRGALLIDLRQAINESKNGVVRARNVRVSYLEAGDSYDLSTRRARLGESKENEAVLRFRQGSGTPQKTEVLYADMFGDNVIVHALARLTTGHLPSLAGVAFDPAPPADDPHPEMGFEFILRRDGETRAWFDAAPTSEDFSVFDALLDVRPIRVSKPWYRPWR